MPDGNGLHAPYTPVIMEPFVFTSGDDILTNKVPARGLMLVPILYIGDFKSVHRWLILKKGYSPLAIDENVVWEARPIAMTASPRDEVTPCIDLLLAAKPDQGALRTMMNAQDITESIAVRLDAKDKALLRKYRSVP